jgi:adenosylcobinamide-phosphate synthase
LRTAESACELPTAIVLGTIADALLGDPARLHPVAGFGRVAQRAERLLWRPSRRAGLAYCVLLVGGTAAGAALVERRLGSSPARRIALGTAAIWTVVGGRSLCREATLLGETLERGDIVDARRRAPALVGRDPSGLDAAELARAAVESVAENTGDAVVASLFWFAVAGVPGALAHRAVNTLDAMVGNRSERYRNFGWASARLDDLANWAPARLTAALAILVAPSAGGNRLASARATLRDGPKHPSPNAGPIEAAFAGALSLRLGGLNRYGDRLEQRPFLGDGATPTVADIHRAVTLARAVGLAAVIACSCLGWLLR